MNGSAKMPPIAGIVDAARPGLGVEENAALLRRYLYVEQRICRLLAGHLPSVPEMAVKQGMGRHIWEDAEHAMWLRERIGQLRTSPKLLDAAPDDTLATLLDEADWSHDTEELLVGVYQVVKPYLIAAYRWHLATTNPLVDFPTIRLLRFALSEEEGQVAWAEAALAALPESLARAAWKDRLTTLLCATGSITGRVTRAPYGGPPLRSSQGRPTLSMAPARQRDRPTDYDVPVFGDAVDARLLQKMLVRYNEMKAVENVASAMYQTDSMPWAFYHDLARHLWDEVRHSCFGEVMVEQLGHQVTEFPFAIGNSVFYSQVSPLERYALLGIAIEGGAMKYPPGKRAEYEWCRDAARHPLATVFQDYDWADEVLHTQIAREWISYQLNGDLSKGREIAAATKDALGRFRQTWDAAGGAPTGQQQAAVAVALGPESPEE